MSVGEPFCRAARGICPSIVRVGPPRPADGGQSAGVPPSPNSLSTASTPPAEQKHPCVRYVLSPMSRAAQSSIYFLRLGLSFTQHETFAHFTYWYEAADTRKRQPTIRAARSNACAAVFIPNATFIWTADDAPTAAAIQNTDTCRTDRTHQRGSDGDSSRHHSFDALLRSRYLCACRARYSP